MSRAHADGAFQRALKGGHERRVDALCTGLARASGPAAIQREIDEHWRRVARDEAQLGRSFPQHSAVVGDLRINARNFQRGLSQAVYVNACESRGVRVRGAQR